MSKDFLVPWSGVGAKYTQSEIDVVVNTMKTADPLTLGRHTKEFEDSFKRFIGGGDCFAVSSCTAALEISTLLCGIEEGDEVIIPAHTFCATAIPFLRHKANIKWADIDPATRVIDFETIKTLITPKTKAIVVVHLYGLAVDMDPILDLARQNDIFVIEDAAQALGGEYKGKLLGSMGDFGCFSFHTHKNISTLGEGGMLVVRDSELAKLVPGLRHNGVRSFVDQEFYWQPAMSNVDFDLDGVVPYNYCMGEVQAALGTEMLKRVNDLNQARINRAQKFINALSGFDEISFQPVEINGRNNVFYILVAQYENKTNKKNAHDLISLLVNEFKIKVIRPYCPLYKYPLFGGTQEIKLCPKTEYYWERIVAFPSYPWMSEDMFNYLVDSTKKALGMLRGER